MSSLMMSLWRESFRISWEHGSESDVVQSKEEHSDSLHADASTGVRRTTELERVDVRLDRRQIDAVMEGSVRRKKTASKKSMD